MAAGIEQGTTRIVTVATETARAVLKLMDFENMSPRLWGMMWGAEDLAMARIHANNESVDPNEIRDMILAQSIFLNKFAGA